MAIDGGERRPAPADANGEPDGHACPSAVELSPGRLALCVGQRSRPPSAPYRIGVLAGEGSSPEIVQVALDVLEAIAEVTGASFDVRSGGAIGIDAERNAGVALTDSVADFCAETFAAGGAILAGAGGGRFVYDLRRRFDLYCKLNPIRAWRELGDVSRLRCRPDGVDVLVVRENVSGVYYSSWQDGARAPGAGGRDALAGERVLVQQSAHDERDVRRIVAAAARMAALRRGRLAVVVKRGGLPALAALWEKCAGEIAAEHGVEAAAVDVDLAAYRLVQEPETLDVVVAPNLFGDVLSDLGGVVAGSRALTYGGSIAASGAAVFQTNHGSAHDLAGTDRANPAGQVLALAMLLREAFALEREAALIEDALRRVWASGMRTADLAVPGARVLGTREMGRCLTEALRGGGSELLAESS